MWERPVQLGNIPCNHNYSSSLVCSYKLQKQPEIKKQNSTQNKQKKPPKTPEESKLDSLSCFQKLPNAFVLNGAI